MMTLRSRGRRKDDEEEGKGWIFRSGLNQEVQWCEVRARTMKNGKTTVHGSIGYVAGSRRTRINLSLCITTMTTIPFCL